MRFADPRMLWLLAALPLWLVGALWAARRRRAALARFAGGAAWLGRFDAQIGRHRRATKLLLLVSALVCLSLALARPQWGTRVEPVRRVGADVVIVVDRSLSMAAEDLAPNRLAHARRSIDSLLRMLEGDRIALVGFSGRAEVLCPLTVDRAALRLFLEIVDIDEALTPGTALAEGLAVALDTLGGDRDEAEERGRAIVLFTDGEDHEGQLDESIAALRRADVTVVVVGTGTAEGAPIPLRDDDGRLIGYKKDREDRVVTSRLDEPLLERLALETSGHYHRATAGEIEVEAIARSLGGLEAGEFETQLRTRYEERFQIPLLVGWLALLSETLLGDRRRRRAQDAAGAS